ncbi:MAG: NHL repeat-containing protein [Verrucomicrobiia bacterium]
MKKRATSRLFTLLLGFCVTIPCTHADSIYVTIGISPGNPTNGIMVFNTSGGTGSVFAAGDTGAIAFNPAGSLYAVRAGDTIYKYDSNGNSSLFADSSSGLNVPFGLGIDSSGNLYVGNYAYNNIEKFDSSGGTGSVFATGITAPMGLAFDSSGNLYVSDQAGGNIKKFDSSGGTGTVFATGLTGPCGLAFSDGNLYVANAGNSTILKFNSSGQVSTFTSTNLLAFPFGLAFDSSGNLFVACPDNGNLLKFDPSGKGSVFASGLVAPVWVAIAPVPFQITSIVVTNSGVDGNNDLLITWNTSGTTNNHVQVTTGTANGSYSTNGFANVASIVATTATTNYLDVGGATNTTTGARYYRISSP